MNFLVRILLRLSQVVRALSTIDGHRGRSVSAHPRGHRSSIFSWKFILKSALE